MLNHSSRGNPCHKPGGNPDGGEFAGKTEARPLTPSEIELYNEKDRVRMEEEEGPFTRFNDNTEEVMAKRRETDRKDADDDESYAEVGEDGDEKMFVKGNFTIIAKRIIKSRIMKKAMVYTAIYAFGEYHLFFAGVLLVGYSIHNWHDVKRFVKRKNNDRNAPRGFSPEPIYMDGCQEKVADFSLMAKDRNTDCRKNGVRFTHVVKDPRDIGSGTYGLVAMLPTNDGGNEVICYITRNKDQSVHLKIVSRDDSVVNDYDGDFQDSNKALLMASDAINKAKESHSLVERTVLLK